MLHVAAARAAFVERLLFIGHAVAIRVAMDGDVVGIGETHEHAVVERLNHAGEEEVVEEDGVAVERAVVLRGLVARDAAGRRVFTGAVDVLHVGAHLDDVEAAVAIEGDGGRFLDVGFAEDEFEAVAGG